MAEKVHIAVITSTRADWGLLSGPAAVLRDTPGVRLSVIATNMHLSAAHGNTIDEITAEFDVAARVDMAVAGDSPVDRCRAMARCLEGMAEALDRLKPDRVVILGDRYEMLAAASAAAMLMIPIVHLHGGETSLGAIDDSLRHAITKLSALHLTSTESHRRRVIAMGEDPERVINTGAIGVWNALHAKLPTREELVSSLDGFDIGRDTLIVTYHPATADTSATPAEHFAELLKALDARPDLIILFTGTNNDAGGDSISAMMSDWTVRNAHRSKAVKSLGFRRYLAALKYSGACVGNSSSGIIEAPSLGIATVDIGLRQSGRTASESVIHCGDSAQEILAAINKALSPEFRRFAASAPNPYEHEDTLRLISDAILHRCPATPVKAFHDIETQAND